MQQEKKNFIDIVLEVFCLVGLAGSIGLEIYYTVENEVTVIDTLITCLIMAGIYLLLTLMQRYLTAWNIFIPVTEHNRRYALHLALDLKVVLMCMTFYTAVCDVWKIFSSTVIFWCVILLGIFIIIICKYKMWRMNQKDKKDGEGKL